MRQAIVTKYLGPTDYRGSRVKATCQAGSLTLTWDDAMGSDENHDAAATALATKLGWLSGHRLEGGGMPDGRGNCYVLVADGFHTEDDVAVRAASLLSKPALLEAARHARALSDGEIDAFAKDLELEDDPCSEHIHTDKGAR